MYVLLGSLLDLMKMNFKDGFKEDVIATIMKFTLQGLDYIHNQGLIHRDVKVVIMYFI
jgi:serine/threonine-protein kinase OSR1/STK39